MALPITYSEAANLAELMQGDILLRTPELDAVINAVHPYFNQGKYLYFMVITQSCDLVPREGGVCKAPYITIVPVRSVDTVLDRELAESRLPVDSEVPVITQKQRAKLEMFLRRLFNNNEPGYFYLDAMDTELSEDCCAFLNLAISIKAPLHFATCLAAKKLQLKAEWQAKLGWLIAQMYYRVGTEDLTHLQLQAKVKQLLTDATVTIPDAKAKALQDQVMALKRTAPELTLSARDVTLMVNRLASKKDEVIRQAMTVLVKALPPDTPELTLATLQRRLENDAGLTSLLKPLA